MSNDDLIRRVKRAARNTVIQRDFFLEIAETLENMSERLERWEPSKKVLSGQISSRTSDSEGV